MKTQYFELMTNAELAKHLKVSVRTIQKWNNNTPPAPHVVKLYLDTLRNKIYEQ